jgi:hypothetical protein
MALVYQVVWEHCNVFDENDNPTTYHRGDLLPDGVNDVQLQHLTVFGAVRAMESVPTEAEMREAMVTDPVAQPVVNPNQGENTLEVPSKSAGKDAWIEYATDARNPKRLSESQARSMSKDALVDRYTK